MVLASIEFGDMGILYLASYYLAQDTVFYISLFKFGIIYKNPAPMSGKN